MLIANCRVKLNGKKTTLLYLVVLLYLRIIRKSRVKGFGRVVIGIKRIVYIHRSIDQGSQRGGQARLGHR